MNISKYIYTVFGSIIASCCIYNICDIPQYGVFIMVLAFSGIGVGVQLYADKYEQRHNNRESELAKQMQDDSLQLILGCMKEINSEICKNLQENQELAKDQFVQMKGLVTVITSKLEAMERISGESSKMQAERLLSLEKTIGAAKEEISNSLDKKASALREKCQAITNANMEQCAELTSLFKDKLEVLNMSIKNIVVANKNNNETLIKAISDSTREIVDVVQMDRLLAYNSRICEQIEIINAAMSGIGQNVMKIENYIVHFEEYKNEICGQLEQYNDIIDSVAEIKDICGEIAEKSADISDKCNDFTYCIENAITPMKDEVLYKMEGNIEKQENVIEKYEELLGKINDLIVTLSKESDNTLQKLKDFYLVLNTGKRMR